MTKVKASKDNSSPNELIIAVIGPTRTGKSTFISCASELSGNEVINHNLKSEIKPIKINCGGTKVILVDTPGYDDPDMSDTTVLGQLADWLRYTYNGNARLSGIIYMHRISDNRVAGTPSRNLDMFARLCGSTDAERVVLATTMWEKLSSREIGVQREEELKAGLWKYMISRGASYSRFMNTFDSAREIIGLVSEQKLLLQEEMVENTWSKTSAGKTLFDTLQNQPNEEKRLLNSPHLEGGRGSNPQVDQIRKQLEASFKQVQTIGRRLVPFSRSKPTSHIIAVIGLTGAGLSTFITYAARRPDMTIIGSGMSPCTKEVKSFKVKFGEKDVILLDTPGFEDFEKEDTTKMIADWLKGYGEDAVLAGIVYAHRITDNRVVEIPPTKLEMFTQLCRPQATKRIVLATTMWVNQNSPKEGAQRESQLTGGSWKDMMSGGAQYARFEDSFDSAWDIIGKVCEPMEIEKLLFRREMLDLETKLKESREGQALFNMLQEQLEEEKRLLNQFCMKPREGRLARYDQARQQLEATFQQLQTLDIPIGGRIEPFFKFKKGRSEPPQMS